jgi:hypothetical protein
LECAVTSANSGVGGTGFVNNARSGVADNAAIPIHLAFIPQSEHIIDNCQSVATVLY